MAYYSGLIRDYFLRPRNAGEVESADAVGDAGSLVCGAALRLTLKVDAASQTINGAKFKAAGCGYLVAAASRLTEITEGLRVGEAAALSVEEIAREFGSVPPDKTHCVALCSEALYAAAAHYRQSTLEEWTGEEALICTCFGVSEKSIEQAIRMRSLRTVEQVTGACNAGGGCGSCQPLIEDILDDCWRSESAQA